jgi:hypothetical protein
MHDGIHIHFPEGCYRLTEEWYLPDQNGLLFTGDGRDNTFIECAMSGAAGETRCIWLEPGSGRLQAQWTIRDLSIWVTGQFDSNDTALYLGSNHCKDDATGVVDRTTYCHSVGVDVCPVGKTCYSPRANLFALDNIYIAGEDLKYQDATALRVMNANQGIINNIIITGEAGSYSGWGLGINLHEEENVNRGNISVVSGHIMKVDNCIEVGQNASIVNNHMFYGTKCVHTSGTYYEDGSVGMHVFNGTDNTTINGMHFEGFQTPVKIDGTRGNVSIQGCMMSQFAGGSCLDLTQPVTCWKWADDAAAETDCQAAGDPYSCCDGFESWSCSAEATVRCQGTPCYVMDGTAVHVTDAAHDITVVNNRIRPQNCEGEYVPDHCEGGSRDGLSCTVDGDCTGGGTCSANCGTALKLDDNVDGVVWLNNKYGGSFAEGNGTKIDWGPNTALNTYNFLSNDWASQHPNYFGGLGVFRGSVEANTNIRVNRIINGPIAYDFYSRDGGTDTWSGRSAVQQLCNNETFNACQDRCATGTYAGDVCNTKCVSGADAGNRCTDSGDCDGAVACDYEYDCGAGITCDDSYDCGSDVCSLAWSVGTGSGSPGKNLVVMGSGKSYLDGPLVMDDFIIVDRPAPAAPAVRLEQDGVHVGSIENRKVCISDLGEDCTADSPDCDSFGGVCQNFTLFPVTGSYINVAGFSQTVARIETNTDIDGSLDVGTTLSSGGAVDFNATASIEGVTTIENAGLVIDRNSADPYIQFTRNDVEVGQIRGEVGKISVGKNSNVEIELDPVTGDITTQGDLILDTGTYTTTVSATTATANHAINFPNESGEVCLDTGAGCGTGSGGLANYTESFIGQSSVDFTHGLGSADLIVACYDGDGNEIGADISIADTSPWIVTVTFDEDQDGRCVINGAGGTISSSSRHTVSFTSEDTITVSAVDHGLTDAPLSVSCFDNSTPRNAVEYNNATYNDSTGEVVITFSDPESGKCVLQ